MQGSRTTQLGIILFLASVGFAFPWWLLVGHFVLSWYWSKQISALVYAVLMVSPSVALAVAGCGLYVLGRKAFWKSNLRQKRLLAFLGLALMVLGGILGAFYWAMAVYRANLLRSTGGDPLIRYLSSNSPYFILFALWIISGLLMFADAVETLFSKK